MGAELSERSALWVCYCSGYDATYHGRADVTNAAVSAAAAAATQHGIAHAAAAAAATTFAAA